MKITGAVLDSVGTASRPYAESKPLKLRELELDDPGPGELRIKLLAAGVCHSDLSVIDGNRPRPMPMLLGHEATGVVEALGEGVDDLEVGDHVVTVFLPRCEECDNCKTNGKLPCEPGTKFNNDGTLFDGHLRLHDGGDDVYHHVGASGFATHAVLNRKSVVPIGADVPPEIACVLGCAVLTGGGAVRNGGELQDGQDIAIVGLGGVGMAALITAISLDKGKVIGIDANGSKLTRATELGAHEVYTPEQAEEAGIKAPVVVECAGHPQAFETAFRITGVGGRTVTVGLPSPTAESTITPLTLTAEARTVVGSYLGSAIPAVDIPVYEQLWREKGLPVEELISDTIRLEDINEAMDKLADGQAVRQVIIFD